jgi:hypothetical protein
VISFFRKYPVHRVNGPDQGARHHVAGKHNAERFMLPCSEWEMKRSFLKPTRDEQIGEALQTMSFERSFNA